METVGSSQLGVLGIHFASIYESFDVPFLHAGKHLLLVLCPQTYSTATVKLRTALFIQLQFHSGVANT